MKRLLFLACALPFFAHAAILLEGIALRDPLSAERVERAKSPGITAQGIDVPGGIDSLVASLSSKYLGAPLTAETIESLKQDISLYYQERFRPIVSVDIPAQELSFGVVEVNVTEGRLERVDAKGNRWLPDSQVIDATGLSLGNPIQTDQLRNHLAWFNRTPFHMTSVILAPGTAPGTTKLELLTKDRFPLRPYIGGDNTGVNDIVGRARYFGGFNLNNMFKLNDVLSFQYTASSNFSQLQSYTIHYSLPLPWEHLLIVYGGYSSNNPKPDQFTGTGQSKQVSARYTVPFKPLYDASLREFTIGFDWKNTNNNLQYVDFTPFIAVGSIVNIGQFMAGFDYGNVFSIHKVSFSALLFWSPGPMFSHQSDADFQALRYKAENKYVYGRISAGDVITLPKEFSCSALLRCQMSNQNLLPSEQFGLGGYDTIRGYDERELNVDNALCANLEVYAPQLEFRAVGNHRLKFLAFFDYGLGNNVHRLPGEPVTRYLMGTGAGVRYAISEYFSSRLDWGFKLHKIPFGDTSMGKLHVGMVLSY